MNGELSWQSAPLRVDPDGEVLPVFEEDERFNHDWWHDTLDFPPPVYEWRSYLIDGEEVARVHLNVEFFGHLNSEAETPGVHIWELEVRGDRREESIGTAIVDQLDAEFADRNLYAGPTYQQASWWARFGWDECNCADVNEHPMLVRRAAISDPIEDSKDADRDVFAPAGREEIEPDDLSAMRWRRAAQRDDGPDLMDPHVLD